MSFADTISDDYKVTDAVETVVFTPVGRTPTVDGFSIRFADGHALTVAEVVASQGIFSHGDKRWGLGRTQFPTGVKPQAGDKLTQTDGTVWVLVGECILDDLGVSWFCNARRSRKAT